MALQVVNIDNGYGAGHIAAHLTHRAPSDYRQ